MTIFQKRSFFVVVGLQVAVLLYMATSRWHLIETGTPVLLKCAPVDPRSLFSGDYVVLNYEISRLPESLLTQPDGSKLALRTHQTVFVGLRPGSDQKHYVAIAVAESAHQLRQQGINHIIRGTVRNSWSQMVDFGIENYFVPQFQGHAIERNLAHVTVEVALSSSGDSGIRQLLIDGAPVRFY